MTVAVAITERCAHDMVAEFCADCRAIEPDLALELIVARCEQRHPDVDLDTLAGWVTDELSEADIRELLRKLLAEKLSDQRRRKVRAAEERAERDRRRAEEQAAREAAHAERRRELEESDPEARRQERRKREEERSARPWAAPRGTKHYKVWEKLTPEEQAKRRAAKDEEYAEFLRDQYAKYGDYSEIDDLSFSGWRVRKAFDAFADHVREETRLELTEELLGSRFALGDGTAVTWGEASAEQHEQRFSLLMGQAEGTVDAAKRHQAAISILAENGVRCLNEVKVAA